MFDIDWQGTNQIKNQTLNYDLLTFFIYLHPEKFSYDRLIERGEKNDEVIEMRMQQFDKDIQHWKEYDFVVSE